MDEDEPQHYPLRRLPKVEDPGCFVCSCSITDIKFSNSLRDSGANVNVMSRHVAEKLEHRNVSLSNLSFVFGDSSQKILDGLVRDLQLVIEDGIVPTNFHILEMDEKTERPLIFGRAFLATVDAVIDHNNKRKTFINVSKNLATKIEPTTLNKRV
ncbi:hypothetical protein V5N11_026975 [Cardamine amara subsp. amara]|uniref:Aspartic peptidase DDI1-type domain-containing protein n=1 Tax=Cardamine amara subsp. amara TaxID=228776 RepID=A0ABD1BH89_CARAN